jgi:hypothetical protein
MGICSEEYCPQEAFGIPVNTIGWVIGPDWINSTRYVTQAKGPVEKFVIDHAEHPSEN